mgnify:CR=1 FL=1
MLSSGLQLSACWKKISFYFNFSRNTHYLKSKQISTILRQGQLISQRSCNNCDLLQKCFYISSSVSFTFALVSRDCWILICNYYATKKTQKYANAALRVILKTLCNSAYFNLHVIRVMIFDLQEDKSSFFDVGVL